MLRVIRGGRRWLTALFVVGIGGVFVFFLGLGGPLRGPSAGAVVEVGPYRFGVREVGRMRDQHEARYRESLGDNFNAKALDDFLTAEAARTLVERSILALEAQDLGLTVSKDEIERTVVDAAVFRGPDGRFDPAQFDDWAQYEYGGQQNFIHEQRIALLAQKMVRLLQSHAGVSEAEAREATRQKLEEVRIAFAILDPGEPPEGVEIDDEQVAAFLSEREGEAQKLYDERLDRYDAPERVHARHILVTVPADADEATVAERRAAAEAIRQRLLAGEPFEEVAAETSEDVGTAEKGGDLGTFERGQMMKAFEDAAFSLEPGRISDLVRTEAGFHVIRVEEHREAHTRTFEQVREELARELLEKQAALVAARETADHLAEAVRDGGSLEDAARAAGLTLERSGWLTRRPDGFVPGLGPAQDLMATAFALSAGESSKRVFEVGDKLALVQVLEKNEPAPEDVELQVAQVREEILAARRSQIASRWLETRRKELFDAGELYVDLDKVR